MGGSATNVGIEYQQRISALILLSTYLRLDLAPFLDATANLVPTTVAFETADEVDDLRIDCESGETVYLQMKRTVSLSEQPDSEFVKAIQQFARVFLKTPASHRERLHLVLVTTPKSSRKIVEEVRKLVESVRANARAFTVNPLSKSERETLGIWMRIIKRIFFEERGTEASDQEVITLSQRTFVSPLDVENTRSGENAVLMVLATKGFAFPQLIWKYLISTALTFAGNRQSVTCEALTKIMQKFQVPEGDQEKLKNAFSELFRPAVMNLRKLPAGKEVLLLDEPKLKKSLLMELHRFDDDGSTRSSFTGDSVRVKSGAEYILVRRFASLEMAKNYLLENPSILRDQDLVILGANQTEGIEETPAAVRQRELAIEAFTKNVSPMNCLHCGASCLEKNAYMVELDRTGYPYAVGLVCPEHIQPSDRLLGESDKSEARNRYIPDIDAPAWFAAIHRGQGMLNGYRSLRNVHSGIQVVAWNADNSFASDYSYCVRLNLANGSYKYSYVRGKIERMPKSVAEMQVRFFDSGIAKGREAGDPWCIAENSWAVGSKSWLAKMVGDDEAIIEVESTEVSQYSDILGRVYNRHGSYYAPLCIVRDKREESILVLANGVPLISDPYRFAEFVENWKYLVPDITIDDLKLSPLWDDNAFDAFMRRIVDDELVAVIDPTFDEHGDPNGGLVVQEIDKLGPPKGQDSR